MRHARRLLISGRVQAVGFRHFARTSAVAEGLHGWARNLPDGRVEIFAQGDRDALARFERRVNEGPRGARVDTVEASDAPATNEDTSFTIR
jgi:acylphosphatase